MTPVEELTIAAVRHAMAPGYELETVARSLCHRAEANTTALRIARARVERGAGWRAGPIGQRARDALSRAIDLAEHTDTGGDIDLTDPEELNLSRGATDHGAGGLAHH